MRNQPSFSSCVTGIPNLSAARCAASRLAARVNDVKAFLFPLYINARLHPGEGMDKLTPAVEAAVKALP